MNYRIKIAEHPEYADALVAMFGTDDIGRIMNAYPKTFYFNGFRRGKLNLEVHFTHFRQTQSISGRTIAEVVVSAKIHFYFFTIDPTQ